MECGMHIEKFVRISVLIKFHVKYLVLKGLSIKSPCP